MSEEKDIYGITYVNQFSLDLLCILHTQMMVNPIVFLSWLDSYAGIMVADCAGS